MLFRAKEKSKTGNKTIGFSYGCIPTHFSEHFTQVAPFVENPERRLWFAVLVTALNDLIGPQHHHTPTKSDRQIDEWGARRADALELFLGDWLWLAEILDLAQGQIEAINAMAEHYEKIS